MEEKKEKVKTAETLPIGNLVSRLKRTDRGFAIFLFFFLFNVYLPQFFYSFTLGYWINQSKTAYPLFSAIGLNI